MLTGVGFFLLSNFIINQNPFISLCLKFVILFESNFSCFLLSFAYFITEIIKRKKKFGNLYLCIYFILYIMYSLVMYKMQLFFLICVNRLPTYSNKNQDSYSVCHKNVKRNTVRKNVNSNRSKCMIPRPLEHFIFLSRLGEKFCRISNI